MEDTQATASKSNNNESMDGGTESDTAKQWKSPCPGMNQ